MQNIDFGPVKKDNKANDDAELRMSVSPVCRKNDKNVAYVTFEDGKRSAEGEIPLCNIIRNDGFSEEEVLQLEIYMKANLTMLKKTAAGIHLLDAFMGN